ncbi:uncharacterized protein [Venturia canescens]|uniref:uncharacterized protein n=1 Tax=Venturia canescens TaxID=32260 RepID=UPI001C9D3930|nr:uncharacterized protein LOC122412606 [Venturia canescens]
MLRTTNFVLFTGLLAWLSGNGALGTGTTREPSIQAYGLPKRFITGINGYIERVHLSDGVDSEGPERATLSGTRRKSEPKVSTKSYDDDGVIEIFHLDPSPVPGSRRLRSVNPQDEIESGNDLEVQETKVFRPLFAYRKQIEAKQQRQRSERARRNNLPSPHKNADRKSKQFPRYYFKSS